MIKIKTSSILQKTYLFFFFSFLLVAFGQVTAAQSFIHPGLLQDGQDLERIRNAVSAKQELVYKGFQVFESNPESQSSYHMRGPLEMVGRNPTVGQEIYDTDAAAAYQNAIMWTITGQQAYAAKAIEIVNAWSSTLKSITGRDAVLMTGLGPFKMVNAAEILRYSHSGWSHQDILQTEKHFREVIYPVIQDYAPFANGNWDTAAMKTAMAIGVFCNDRGIFEKALRYYIDGAGDGRLTNYIINESGQCQESGRDQAHTQLGIGHLADCSEIAWHQGLDLYAYANNRLLKGIEYTAKYNLGFDVPYTPEIDQTGKYLHQEISVESRGKFRTIYEEIYNHYVNRMGLSAPYTQQVVEKIRPELQGSGGDNMGFGTLLFFRAAEGTQKNIPVKPMAPAGLIAKTSGTDGNTITWITPTGANHYTLKRAERMEGPYVTVAENIAVSQFTDHQVKNGKLYYYTVSALGTAGESINAYPVAITAGLPQGWKEQVTGSGVSYKYAAFDGDKFTLESNGIPVENTDDHFQMLFKEKNGNGGIVCRYVPQVSSQTSVMGLTMREGRTGHDAEVSLLLRPESSKVTESPRWIMMLSSKSMADTAVTKNISSPVTAESIITYGRLTGYCWFRLDRSGNEFTGYFSSDGQTWQKVGTVECSLKENYQTGLIISSGNAAVNTRINFDHIALK